MANAIDRLLVHGEQWTQDDPHQQKHGTLITRSNINQTQSSHQPKSLVDKGSTSIVSRKSENARFYSKYGMRGTTPTQTKTPPSYMKVIVRIKGAESDKPSNNQRKTETNKKKNFVLEGLSCDGLVAGVDVNKPPISKSAHIGERPIGRYTTTARAKYRVMRGVRSKSFTHLAPSTSINQNQNWDQFGSSANLPVISTSSSAIPPRTSCANMTSSLSDSMELVGHSILGSRSGYNTRSVVDFDAFEFPITRTSSFRRQTHDKHIHDVVSSAPNLETCLRISKNQSLKKDSNLLVDRQLKHNTQFVNKDGRYGNTVYVSLDAFSTNREGSANRPATTTSKYRFDSVQSYWNFNSLEQRGTASASGRFVKVSGDKNIIESLRENTKLAAPDLQRPATTANGYWDIAMPDDFSEFSAQVDNGRRWSRHIYDKGHRNSLQGSEEARSDDDTRWAGSVVREEQVVIG